MNNLVLFFTNPNTFYGYLADNKQNKYLFGVFILYVFISILWEITLGIPYGDYDILFFDNKLFDALFSVFLNTIIMFFVIGSLYLIPNRSIRIQHKFIKSWCIVFSLLIISNTALSIHLVIFILFGNIISLDLLLIVIFLYQITCLFIGIRIVFGFSVLRTLFVEFVSLIAAGIFLFAILLGEYYFFNYNKSETDTTKAKRSSDPIGNTKITTHSMINEIIIGDKNYGLFKFDVSYIIYNPMTFKDQFNNITLANTRIEDICMPTIEKEYLEYIHIEKMGDEIDSIGNDISKQIVKECNEVLQNKNWGIQITSLEIKKMINSCD
jgi:hypothetical protein